MRCPGTGKTNVEANAEHVSRRRVGRGAAAAPDIGCQAVRRSACDHKGDRQRGDGAVG